MNLQDRCIAYLEPCICLFYAFFSWSVVLLTAFLTLDTRALFSFSTLADRAFAKLWLAYSPEFTLCDNDTAIPSLVSLCSGTVLEIGPGSGSQLARYNLPSIGKIYGVEPVLTLHPALLAKIKENQLSDVYELVPCRIQDAEALEKYGITESSVDCILSVQVLCSVPDPEGVLKRLYALLKPGGRLVVYEHVANDDLVSRIVQKFYTHTRLWPLAMGNCHLDRPTEGHLLRAGEWAKNELRNNQEENARGLFPRVFGVLTKPE